MCIVLFRAACLSAAKKDGHFCNLSVLNKKRSGSASFDIPHWNSENCPQLAVGGKSPEPGMWFHYSVIILYSSSRPTCLSSACNNNKSNQRECSALRENEHQLKNTFISLDTFSFLSSCCFTASFPPYLFSASISKTVEFSESWFVAASVLLLNAFFCIFLATMHTLITGRGMEILWDAFIIHIIRFCAAPTNQTRQQRARLSLSPSQRQNRTCQKEDTHVILLKKAPLILTFSGLPKMSTRMSDFLLIYHHTIYMRRNHWKKLNMINYDK